MSPALTEQSTGIWGLWGRAATTGLRTIIGLHPESTSHTHLWGWRYDGTSKHPGARNKICGAAIRKEGLPIIFQGLFRPGCRSGPWKMIGSPSFLVAAPHILFLAPGCLLVPSYRHPHKCVWDVLSGWIPIIVYVPTCICMFVCGSTHRNVNVNVYVNAFVYVFVYVFVT